MSNRYQMGVKTMGLRVVVLAKYDSNELEDDINKFLTGRRENEVINIAYSTSGGAILNVDGDDIDLHVVYSALIYYKEA